MNFGLIQAFAQKQQYITFPIKVGQQLEIHEYLGESDNNRVWKFKCLVIAVHNPAHHDGSFTVIGESSGVKIEKVYPMSFKRFAKIILLDEFKVRKSKIYYIKDKVGKDARLKSLISKDAR
jgi:large subunit ribosomal protein L19